MPTFSTEYVRIPHRDWHIDRGFHIKLGNLDPALVDPDNEPIMRFPRGVILRGDRAREIRTPLHWLNLVDTLVEADELVLTTGRGVRLDGAKRMVVRIDDTAAAQLAGLFYQAHGRVILGPNGKGDSFKLNGYERTDPVMIPMFPDQQVVFESSALTFAGLTEMLKKTGITIPITSLYRSLRGLRDTDPVRK